MKQDATRCVIRDTKKHTKTKTENNGNTRAAKRGATRHAKRKLRNFPEDFKKTDFRDKNKCKQLVSKSPLISISYHETIQRQNLNVFCNRCTNFSKDKEKFKKFTTS